MCALCLALAAGGCGSGGKPLATTTEVTVSGTYRYPPTVINSFMRSCTKSEPTRERLCACVIDELSNSVSSRDFARIAREGRAVPRVERAIKRATTACAGKS